MITRIRNGKPRPVGAQRESAPRVSAGFETWPGRTLRLHPRASLVSFFAAGLLLGWMVKRR